MMRTSVRSVTNFVSQAPDNLLDGIQKASDIMSDNLFRFSDKAPGSGPERRTSAEEFREQMGYNVRFRWNFSVEKTVSRLPVNSKLYDPVFSRPG